MIGLYVPGRSVLHGAPAGAKLLGLAASAVVVIALPVWWMTAIALAGTITLFAVAGVPARIAWRQAVPVLWIVGIAAPLNALFSGWESALGLALRISTLVLLAALVTLTTRVSAMLDAVQHGLRVFGDRIDADRVGLAIALTVRAIPLMAELVREVLDARRARGAEGSVRAIAVPVVVRALKTADGFGEALVARGLDD